jgi:hypothetical protein
MAADGGDRSSVSPVIILVVIAALILFVVLLFRRGEEKDATPPAPPRAEAPPRAPARETPVAPGAGEVRQGIAVTPPEAGDTQGGTASLPRQVEEPARVVPRAPGPTPTNEELVDALRRQGPPDHEDQLREVEAGYAKPEMPANLQQAIDYGQVNQIPPEREREIDNPATVSEAELERMKQEAANPYISPGVLREFEEAGRRYEEERQRQTQ